MPPTPTTAASVPAGSPRADLLRWAGLLLVLAPLLTRATVAGTTLPAWDLNPLMYPDDLPGLGPAGSMLIDALVLAGAAMLLFSEVLARRRINALWLAAAAAGGVAIALHGWWWQAIGSAAPHGTLGNQRIGSAWFSAVLAAVAIVHAARDSAVRRVIAATVLGLVVLLALRGAQQVLIDHPNTLADLEADPDQVRLARGWSEDSPMWLAYLRRARQPDATGWFGLSNIYASFAAGGLALAVAWVVSLLRSSREQAPATAIAKFASVACLSAAGTAVYLADSKGGYAVAALALALTGLPWLASRLRPLRRLASVIGPLCIFGALAAVVVRGMIGERIGELSILFRWFYMQASARIFAEHPSRGVGPDGFQLAYLEAKNPLSPEEVASPHSILLDWLATLGITGLAWVAMLIALSVLASRSLLSPSSGDSAPAPSPDRTRRAVRTAMLTTTAATIAALWIESPLITIDSALVRMVAMGMGCLLAVAVVAGAADAWLRVGLAAAALAMLAHAQIELTGSNTASAGLWLAMLAAAAAPGMADSPPAPAHRWTGRLAAAACGLAAVTLTALGVLRARAWESDLLAAAGAVRPIAEINERFRSLSQPRSAQQPRDDPARLLADLSRLVGEQVPPTQEGFTAAMAALDRRLLPEAIRLLESAYRRYPDDWRVGREIGGLQFRLAAAHRQGGDERAARESMASVPQSIIECAPAASAERALPNPPRLRAVALALESVGRATSDTALIDRSIQVLIEAMKHDPANLDIAVRLFRLSSEFQSPQQARPWAELALKLDDLSRLDRQTRGLAPSVRQDLERAVKSVP